MQRYKITFLFANGKEIKFSVLQTSEWITDTFYSNLNFQANYLRIQDVTGTEHFIKCDDVTYAQIDLEP